MLKVWLPPAIPIAIRLLAVPMTQNWAKPERKNSKKFRLHSRMLARLAAKLSQATVLSVKWKVLPPLAEVIRPLEVEFRPAVTLADLLATRVWSQEWRTSSGTIRTVRASSSSSSGYRQRARPNEHRRTRASQARWARTWPWTRTTNEITQKEGVAVIIGSGLIFLRTLLLS